VSFAFPALEFSQEHEFEVSQGSVDALFGEVGNIYNSLWKITSIGKAVEQSISYEITEKYRPKSVSFH